MDIIDELDDFDLADVKTPYFPSSVPVTTSVAANATAIDNATVDATATASCFAPFLIDPSRSFDVPMLNMLPDVIAEGMAPNIQVTIHSKVLHMMLDSGAQVSVLPSELVDEFDPPVPLPSVTREVRTFGNHQVVLRGPITLDLQLCGFRTRHPFYFIDVSTPVIGGYDLMKAARLVVDVANRRVWSRPPESASKGPIGPNPEFPVCDNSVHSSVAMTEPQHAHRVVVQEPTASERSSTEQTLNSVAGKMGQDKQASKTFGVLAPRKRRRTVSGDLFTPPQELSEPATSTDVNQPDVKRAYTGRTPQCFCVDAIQSEDEEDVVATIAEINQCYQDHVDAVRSRSVYCMLSDTEYSDFDESDEDEEWAEYRQCFQDFMEESDEPDFDVVTDEEELDVEEQEVDVLPSQHPVDIFQFEFGIETDSPILPPPIQFRDAPTESAESDFTDFTCFTPQEEAKMWSGVQQLQQTLFSEAETTCSTSTQYSPAQPQDNPDQSAQFIAPPSTTGPSQLSFDQAHVSAVVSALPHTSPRVSSCVYGQSLVSWSSSHTPHSSSRHSFSEGVRAETQSLGCAAVVNNVYVPPPCAPSSVVSRQVSAVVQRPVITSRVVLDPCDPSFQPQVTQLDSPSSVHSNSTASFDVVADSLFSIDSALPSTAFAPSVHLPAPYTHTEPDEPKPPDIAHSEFDDDTMVMSVDTPVASDDPEVLRPSRSPLMRMVT